MVSRIIAVVILTALTLSAQADEFLPSLKVKDEVYTNVTVTTVTDTDVYFTHARGIGSAKLKDLAPDLQKHFHFNAAKGAAIEKEQAQATVDYRAKLVRAQAAADYRARIAERMAQQKPRPPTSVPAPAVTEEADFVAPSINARSIRGEPAPQFEIEKWITDEPTTSGKFILIDFWATWCPPCRRSISELNNFQNTFADRLTVIGVSDETEEDVRRMVTPKIEYAVAIDTQKRMYRTLEINAIPHCILISPDGIVRFEGNPLYLNEKILKHFLDKYSG